MGEISSGNHDTTDDKQSKEGAWERSTLTRGLGRRGRRWPRHGTCASHHVDKAHNKTRGFTGGGRESTVRGAHA